MILDVELELVDNVVYRSERRLLDYREFPDVLDTRDRADPSYRVDVRAPLDCAAVVAAGDDPLHLSQSRRAAARRFRRSARSARSSCGGSSSTGSSADRLAMRMKWFAEKYIEPRLESCTVSRNQAQGEGRGLPRVTQRADARLGAVSAQRADRRDRHPARVLHSAGPVRAVHRRAAADLRENGAPTC